MPMKSLFVSVSLMLGLLASSAGHAGVVLTDTAAFSANSSGENWNGWIWNTVGLPDDPADRWNVYYSSSADPDSPTFINTGNDTNTSLSIDLEPGVHSFLIYGESVTTTLDPLQHFVLNLYFEGNRSAPDISGLYGSTCFSVCAASHWNGLDLFGTSGLGGNTSAQEAGALTFELNGYLVELTNFTWSIGEGVDEVWPHWDDAFPYNSGSGTPDFVGELELQVNAVAVSEPGSFSLFASALAFLGLRRLRRRRPRLCAFKHHSFCLCASS